MSLVSPEIERGADALSQLTFRPSAALRFGVGAILIVSSVVFGGLAVVFVTGIFTAETFPMTLFFIAGAALLAPLAAYMPLLFLPLASRIDLDASGVRLRSVRWRGAVPLPPLLRAHLPYSEIGSVERKDEIFTPLGITSIQTVWSITDKDGRRYELGRNSPQAVVRDHSQCAAREIAARAGLPITDAGAYRMGGVIGSFRRGAPLGGRKLTQAEHGAAQGKAARTMQVVFGIVAVTIAIRACSEGG
jgi:hypothetical protein